MPYQRSQACIKRASRCVGVSLSMAHSATSVPTMPNTAAKCRNEKMALFIGHPARRALRNSPWERPGGSWLRPPRRSEQHLVGLRLQHRPQLLGEGHEVVVGEQAPPVVAAVLIAVEAPQVD